ncbi:hypothetical protein [Burkholderia sp. PAMC 26561]|uniref:hypothetical protein n=1 Tax=Burkholderia sp. PAMC 26561 TaxID=1795043 RepID=UPI00076B5023|nr:hypothetical protein [Burkholderia sp. PAMC 26561]AME28651.1 hypothetical protein AXG89_33215 [Burkholderia sp. PAMC 26561]
MQSNKRQIDLDQIWADIKAGKYQGDIKPEIVSSHDGIDIMSIPTNDGSDRDVYERKSGGGWITVPDIGTTIESFQTLRSAKAYWSSDRPDVLSALKVAPELLSNADLVHLIRELDRRFIQLWDKVTFERDHDLVDYSRLPGAHRSRECGDPE